MNVEEAWEEGVTGKGVAVTILDDGKLNCQVRLVKVRLGYVRIGQVCLGKDLLCQDRSSQVRLGTIGQVQLGKDPDMNVEESWEEGVTGKGVAVTILDDGKLN